MCDLHMHMGRYPTGSGRGVGARQEGEHEAERQDEAGRYRADARGRAGPDPKLCLETG